MEKKTRFSLIYFFIAMALILLIENYLLTRDIATITYSEFKVLVSESLVSDLQIRQDAIEGKLLGGIEADGLVIDIPSHRAELDGMELDLTPSEFKLLVTLAGYPGRVYRRMELVEKVLGYDFEGYERAIDSHVKNLRAKLDDDPREPRFIHTVTGVGYRFETTGANGPRA